MPPCCLQSEFFESEYFEILRLKYCLSDITITAHPQQNLMSFKFVIQEHGSAEIQMSRTVGRYFFLDSISYIIMYIGAYFNTEKRIDKKIYNNTEIHFKKKVTMRVHSHLFNNFLYGLSGLALFTRTDKIVFTLSFCYFRT